eukprot:jgi/Mesvir1/4331/Mv25761-RA.4
MRVTFWGTRGSVSKAGKETVRYGGHTCCVHIVTNSGTHLILDCGTGAHDLGAQLARRGTAVEAHVLVSHTHWAHIQGLPFFSPLFIPGNDVHIYGPHGLRTGLQDALRGEMQSKYFPLTLDSCGAHIEYHELAEETFTIGDVTVTTQLMNHNVVTLGYRIQADGATVVYCTDHEPHDGALAAGGTPERASADDRHCGFLSEADLVIHDCPYVAAEYPSKAGWGHSTVEYVVDMALHAQAHEVALFHHDPLRCDDDVDALVAVGQDRMRQHMEKLTSPVGGAQHVAHKLRVTGATERQSMWLGECGKEGGVPKSTWLSLEDAEGYLEGKRSWDDDGDKYGDKENEVAKEGKEGQKSKGCVAAAPTRSQPLSTDIVGQLPYLSGTAGTDKPRCLSVGSGNRHTMVVFAADAGLKECIRAAVAGDTSVQAYFAESLEDLPLLLDNKKPQLVLLGDTLEGTCPDSASGQSTGTPAKSLLDQVREMLPEALCMVASKSRPRDTCRPGVADWLHWPFAPSYALARITAAASRQPIKWLAAGRCHDEERRVAALHALDLLDTPSDAR